MFSKTLIPATMAAVIALTTAGAAVAAAGEHESAREMSVFLNSKTSMSQAIATAEKHTAGRAMKADMRHENGAYLHRIKTVSKDKVSEVFIDPASGTIARTDEDGSIATAIGKEEQAEVAKLTASPVTLAAAVVTAEKATGGKAIEAALENKNGKTLVEVEVAKGKATQKVMIDLPSGKVVKISAADKDEQKEK